ncbi:MAG: TlpA family protein disulfide reductase, partial [candidate division Zixibacteria bacterium]|nr:TlpA family protein disulfide reductase [candidate division Zixibacteria bacterium]
MGGIKDIDSLLRADSGKWVLVNFWATWCRPCVAETPDLVALHQALHSRPFTIVGVSMDFAVFGESTAIRKVTQFGAQSKVEYPNVIFGGRTDDLTGHFHLSG